eukprot:3392386-Pyramimonas_sp.AAC.1
MERGTSKISSCAKLPDTEDIVLASQRLEHNECIIQEKRSENGNDVFFQHAVQMANELEICDRTFHFRTYENCFIGKDAVTWLVRTRTVLDRVEAVQLGEQMVEAGFIYHVLGEHDFKDMNLYYR